uniref:holo-[acyl-carrier-protein] synthase n=1 Tax=Dunaliella tertiolecta TaxID=3047 RepID=A0A7S3QM64_DUNTE|mmetsp:Transcript_1710/g.4301  ORF Transcript_1710/g.4301 Transcript_1710/m.4301 type:complete len:287 (+) Transcript_1710:437-1297(+)|eukprot:CAMPEP_0202344204 /NCGR_PEP_ID=MMETSP1126-20121109/3998_1 /ASSEMBLY_ACC=CAM_ASM_000457 /TAXON_ID=3047 /ORGANISM="Dunaliella tertiolecta, Strain CCMP1320" /LENGTH=286 /DNA_ID=CAMNT_0048935385 /DNA_START=402 /DNA_END=1262 /DNA_ORIENTATION=-
MLRLAVETAAWDASLQFDHFLAYLPAHEQEDVLRFFQLEDRKRALASRMLQRAAISAVCGVPLLPPSAIAVQRTKGRRPFTLNRAPDSAPNWNFNVSHEGSFTVLVSEPYAATGVDVCAPTQLRRRPGVPLLQGIVPFKSQFAPEEWSLIQSFAHDEALAGAAFQRLWSLKESYIKARGDGLGFEPLSRARFVFEGEDAWSARASVVVDGKPCPRWGFSLHELPHGHWVAVAKGDPQDIVDAQKGFTRTLRCPAPTDEELRRHTCPAFTIISMEQLLQPSSLPLQL